MNGNGLFISLEGIDASGKTGVVEAAEEQLPHVHTTAEPAEQYWTGEATRRAIDSDNTPSMTDFYFFMGDRAYHIEYTIKPALNSGKTVISDRYIDSTLAYQQESLSGEVDDPETFIRENLEQDWMLWPDITILIDISPEESARRKSEKDDKYEATDFLRTVRQNYLDLAEDNPRIIVVDGERPKQEVIGEVLTIIHEAQVQNELGE